MALGTATLIKQGGQKQSAPMRVITITLVGDGAYPAGGTAAFKAKIKTLLGINDCDILAVVDQSQPDTVSALEYDHTNDKLFARVRATGVESAVADQSAITYRLAIFLG